MYRTGKQLADARVRRGLTVPEVATFLGFSPSQVTALEQVRPEAFYGAEYYATALRKYLTYLGLPVADQVSVLVGPAVAAAPSTQTFLRGRAVGDTDPATQERSSSARTTLAILASAAVASSAVAGWWFLAGRSAPGRNEPTAASPTPSRTTDPVGPEPTLAPPASVEVPTPAATGLDKPGDLLAVLSAKTDDQQGSVTVARRTWVFVRYADNTIEERGLASGETLVFRSSPIYVAVGVAEGALVVVDGRPIDTSPFVVNGQLRIGRAFLGMQLAGG